MYHVFCEDCGRDLGLPVPGAELGCLPCMAARCTEARLAAAGGVGARSNPNIVAETMAFLAAERARPTPLESNLDEMPASI